MYLKPNNGNCHFIENYLPSCTLITKTCFDKYWSKYMFLKGAFGNHIRGDIDTHTSRDMQKQCLEMSPKSASYFVIYAPISPLPSQIHEFHGFANPMGRIRTCEYTVLWICRSTMLWNPQVTIAPEMSNAQKTQLHFQGNSK